MGILAEILEGSKTVLGILYLIQENKRFAGYYFLMGGRFEGSQNPNDVEI